MHFPALLRYNWHIIWCKFKVYNMMIWCTYIHIYIFQNNYQNKVSLVWRGVVCFLFFILASLGLCCGTGASPVAAHRLLLSWHKGFSLWCRTSLVVAHRLLLLWSMDSRAHGLSSCGMWASVVAVQGLFICSTRTWLTCGIWDLSSPTRDGAHIPCIERHILNHSTSREFPRLVCI